MKLIVGLGNPGSRYEHTRHNVGCLVVRQLARRHRVIWRVSQVRHGFVYGTWPTVARLMRPLFNDRPSQHAVPIMMNQSGEALARAAQTWRMGLQDILLVCDDVNLPLETLRLRPQGSDGGHHGLASCLEQLQSQAIPRLRVGVGIQPLPKDLTDFVLSPFTKQEQRVLDQALNRAVVACELWAVEGMQVAMNRVNVRTP